MSFWPFSNSFNNNSQLQKFLENILDFESVQIEDFMQDATLLQELVSELHSVKNQYNNSSFALSQLLQQQMGTQTASGSNGSSLFNDTDTNSISSSNDNIGNGSNAKDSRSAKLIELLIQPHILNGFLDYIVQSVDYFHEASVKEQKELEQLLNKVHDETVGEDLESLKHDSDDEIDSGDGKGDGMDEDKSSEEFNDEESLDEKIRRCIQVSADILSIDLWVISNRIIEVPLVIDKLWLILYLENLVESSPTVNHVVRIFDQLMNTNSIELLNYLRNKQDLVSTFLNKLEVPMLMDFFLRVIQSDKPDSPTGIVDILYAQDLIPRLIDILKPDPSQFQLGESLPNHELIFRQTAATDFIKALITISSNTTLAVAVDANIGPNQLTRQLVSKEIVEQMVHSIMLYTIEHPKTKIKLTNKHGINNCVGIVIELIRKNNSDYDLNCGTYSSLLQSNNGEPVEVNPYVMFQWLKDFEQNTPGPKDPIYLGEMLVIFSDNLDKFCELMEFEPEVFNVDATNNNVLGFSKFRIAELIAELLHCSNMVLNNSKKIRKVVEIRDIIRENQSKRLQNALSDPLTKVSSIDVSIDDISHDVVDMSLEDHLITSKSSPSSTTLEKLLDGENGDFTKYVDSLELEDESDDEEPTISAEKPFVCKDRDQSIRENPCVGDYFKTKLIDSNILLDIISKFTKYPWHNFFHNVVFDLIQQIFNGKLNSYNSFLISHLFEKDDTNLIKIIINSYKDDYELRPGYLGHLILISEEVVKFTSLYKPDLISPLIVNAVTSDEWNWFVNEVLLKTREVYNVVLGADTSEQDYDEDTREEDNDNDQHEYGFDSSTVGFLDMDSYEQKSKPKDQYDDDEEADDNEGIMSTMSEVRIQDMSPKPEEMENDDSFGDEYDQEVDDFSHDGLLENLSDSDSSDEELESNEANPLVFSDENRLTRVKNHSA